MWSIIIILTRQLASTSRITKPQWSHGVTTNTQIPPSYVFYEDDRKDVHSEPKPEAISSQKQQTYTFF